MQNDVLTVYSEKFDNKKIEIAEIQNYKNLQLISKTKIRFLVLLI